MNHTNTIQDGQSYTPNPSNWYPYNTPTSTPNMIQQNWQPTPALTIEERLAAIEKQVKEIKDILEQIKWRV